MVAELYKSIRPKSKLSSKKVRAQLLNALRTEGKVIVAELDKTTRTWKGDKPTFKFELSFAGGDVTLLIGPGGNTHGAQKWVWLNEGTKPHIIRARNAPLLRFRTTFVPKTKVGVFASGPGRIAPPWRSTFSVNHPGNAAREWSSKIVQRRKKKFRVTILQAAKV